MPKLSDDQLRAITDGEMRQAVGYWSGKLANQRLKAMAYYLGEAKLDLSPPEVEGRSSVVSPDVRNTIESMLPQLMVKFCGGDSVVEFEPNKPGDEPKAEQATDYCNHLFFARNNGERVAYTWMKDALLSKNGIIKVWWDTRSEETREEYMGMSDIELAQLMDDDEIEVTEQKSYPDEDDAEQRQEAIQQLNQQLQQAAMAAQQGNPQAQQAVMQLQQQLAQIEQQPAKLLFDVTCKRVVPGGRVKVENVPPEEFLIDRRARSIETAEFVAHRRYVTVSDLVKMGYEWDEVQDLGFETLDDFEGNQEAFDRNPQAFVQITGRTDTTSRKVLYIEGYVYVDMDGDGIAELCRVCVAGTANKILHYEACDFIPFVDFCPDPEPHTFFGMSIADVTMDIQLIKSNILRNTLDSLAQAIHPRTGVVEGQVNLEDVMNTEVGGIIRMRAPGMVQPFTMPFVGQQAFPMLQYMDELRENRTGISKAASGLDANALQSSTRAAVAATITAAAQHIELICRIFAETGMKDLFRKSMQLIAKNQDAPRMVRLRNTFVPIDPRVWDTSMDVVVNVAIGTGSNEEKMAFLGQVAAKQEMLMQMGAPLVDMQGYYNTLAQMMSLAGYKDPTVFFKDPAMMPPPPPPAPPQPTPEEMLSQVQMEAIRADIQKKAAELELQREEMLRKDDRERDKLDADMMIKAAEIEAKYGAQVNTANIEALMQRDRELLRQQGEMERVAMQAQQAQQNAQMAQAVQQAQMPTEMQPEMPPEGMM